MGKEDLPSLNETISILRAEEGTRSVMLENQERDGSALVTKVTRLREPSLPQPVIQADPFKPITRESNRDSLFCTYCKKHRHTKEKCWKLHGRPNPNANDRGHAHVMSTQYSENSQNLGSKFNKD